MNEELLPPDLSPIASRLANEGVPIAVMARAFQLSALQVRNTLAEHLANGTITELPRDDWPPTSRRADHLPSQLAKEQDDHLLTACMRAFNITKLQSSFMLVLLKRDEADKDTLHHVIESQRAIRRNQPDNPDTTDPKMVDVVICNLRKRLRPYFPSGHETIKTLWGHGYYMERVDRDLAMAKIHAVVQVTDGACQPSQIGS